jgi:hypothetical protein
MTTCTSCGNNVAGKNFCPHCGASAGNVIEYRAPAPLTCTHCGRQSDPGVHFCNACGSQLHQQQPASYPEYHQPPYGHQVPGAFGVPGQPQMVLCCPTCRTLWVVGTPYCQSCHSNLIGVVPTPVYALSHPGEMHSHHHHGQPFPHGKHKKHKKHDHHHSHSGPLDGMGGMLAAGAGGLLGGMILGEVVEEIFDDD